METREDTHECTIIRVDFVGAGAARKPRGMTGSARVIDIAEARAAAARTALDSLIPPRPQRPRGTPGQSKGPF